MTGYHESNFLGLQFPPLLAEFGIAGPVEVYPSLAWDNLFDNCGSLQNISILDRIKGRAQDLSRCVSATDQGKLEEYLTSVRDVEKRVGGVRKDKADAENQGFGWTPMQICAVVGFAIIYSKTAICKLSSGGRV
jgi:hypothetical protein